MDNREEMSSHEGGNSRRAMEEFLDLTEQVSLLLEETKSSGSDPYILAELEPRWTHLENRVVRLARDSVDHEDGCHVLLFNI